MIKINSLLILSFILLPVLGLFAQNDKNSDDVNRFIENWHKNAAEADTVYFDKIADGGIYIGTDATEYWTKEEFIEWSRKYFERGKAWTFTTINRNIYFSDDKKIAWFDELVNTGMGVCRASGVLQFTSEGWEILHYHLGITIPNEHVKEIKQIIENN